MWQRFGLYFIACVATTLAAMPHTAHAFGYDGHRVVCAIAWDSLKPTTRNAINRIISNSVPGKTGRAAFVESCLWADEIGAVRKDTRPHHYINVARDAVAIDLARDCPASSSCVIAAIPAQEQTLRTATTPDAKRDALRFLAHYVGDIHQPLHTGYSDDRGGNAIKGVFMGKDSNLHGLWDYGLMEATGEHWQNMVRRLERDITRSNRRSWTLTGPLEWGEESFIAARSPQALYKLETQGFNFNMRYANDNLPVIDERLKMAGVRLTQVLERVFAAPRK